MSWATTLPAELLPWKTLPWLSKWLPEDEGEEPFVGILDANPTYASYSTRQLKSTQVAGITIRELGGSLETDLGFDRVIDAERPFLSEADAIAHCGVNDGVVVAWIDGNGLSRDIGTAIGAAQPKIYDGATQKLLLENARPCMMFDGVDDFLDGAIGTIPQPFTAIFVVKAETADPNNFIFSGKTNISPYFKISAGGLTQMWAPAPSLNSFADQSGAQHMFSMVYHGANSSQRVDEVELVAGATGGDSLGGLRIGSEPAGGSSWLTGCYQELHLIPTDGTTEIPIFEPDIKGAFSTP